MLAYGVTKTPSSMRPERRCVRSTHQAVSPVSSIRASPTISPICHAGGGRCCWALNSGGSRKSRSLRVAKRISPRMRETRNVRISSAAWSRPITYQLPSCGSSAYGSIVRARTLSRAMPQ